MTRSVHTDDAPAAVGAYSQATTDGSLLFTAGQIPLTPDGELLADEPITVQTEQALDNLLAILETADTTPENVLKVTIFLDDASIEEQTEQALDNLVAILEEEDAGPEDVLKVSVFLSDIEDFEAMNETYATYFDDEPPARSALEVAALPKGVGIEIEAVASLE